LPVFEVFSRQVQIIQVCESDAEYIFTGRHSYRYAAWARGPQTNIIHGMGMEKRNKSINVLLVEDDEEDYILVRAMLSAVPFQDFALKWVDDLETALEEMEGGGHDVCLLDYRLGARDGMELLRKAKEKKVVIPIILLTGRGDYRLDVEAMKTGATDYLVKGEINPTLLERSMRYAIERKHAEEALKKSEKARRLLSSRILTAQEEERKRIARDLHDSTCQTLGLIKMTCEKALAQMDRKAPAAETLETLLPSIPEAIEDIRRIIQDLRPPTLDDFGLLMTITWFCREFEETYPGIQIVEKVGLSEADIPDPLKVIIYRVLQEAMNNIAKHSKANLVSVYLHKRNGDMELTIEDNGIGFDPKSNPMENPSSKGIGLGSMRERVELSGGTFSLESSPGSGTRIRVSWPLTGA
jgi:signal transduction histidine kinase